MTSHVPRSSLARLATPAVLVLATLPSLALAQPAIRWSTTADSGGSRLAGTGGIVLVGTAGQIDAGRGQSAGPTIRGGYWPGAVAPPVPCPADFNSDGNLDPDDLADYIACFFDSTPCAGADVNGDGNADPDDLSDYIGLFFMGC